MFAGLANGCLWLRLLNRTVKVGFKQAIPNDAVCLRKIRVGIKYKPLHHKYSPCSTT